jgi:hypothetical protein
MHGPKLMAKLLRGLLGALLRACGQSFTARVFYEMGFPPYLFLLVYRYWSVSYTVKVLRSWGVSNAASALWEANNPLFVARILECCERQGHLFYASEIAVRSRNHESLFVEALSYLSPGLVGRLLECKGEVLAHSIMEDMRETGYEDFADRVFETWDAEFQKEVLAMEKVLAMIDKKK